MDAHLPAHHLPGDIERTSLSILNAELEAQGIRLSGPCAPVIRRVIHATADFDFARALHFTPGAVEAGISALRAGARTVLYPKDNAEDLQEVPESVRASLEFLPVATLSDVLSIVFDPARAPAASTPQE